MLHEVPFSLSLSFSLFFFLMLVPSLFLALTLPPNTVLLQQGLRFTPRSLDLWLTYFRFELLFVDRLKQRREVLGIDGKAVEEEIDEEEKTNAATTIDVDALLESLSEYRHENPEDARAARSVDEVFEELNTSNDTGSREGGGAANAMRIILDGALPLAVYKNAVKSFVFPPLFIFWSSFFVDVLFLFFF